MTPIRSDINGPITIPIGKYMSLNNLLIICKCNAYRIKIQTYLHFNNLHLKGKHQFKTNTPAHIVNTLALFGNCNRLAIYCIEILRDIQMIGISHIGKISTVHKKGTDHPACFRIYKICSGTCIE